MLHKNFHFAFWGLILWAIFSFSAQGAGELSQPMTQLEARKLANELLFQSRKAEYNNLKETTIDLETNKVLSIRYRKRNPDGTLWERIEYLKPNGELFSVTITNDAGTFKIVGDTVIKNEYDPISYPAPPEPPKTFYAKKIDEDTVDVNGQFIVRRRDCKAETFATVLSWTAPGYKPPEAPLDPDINYQVTEEPYDGIPCYRVRIERKITPERIRAEKDALRHEGRPTGKFSSGALPAVSEYYLRKDDYVTVAFTAMNAKGKTLYKLRYTDITLNVELPDQLFRVPKGERVSFARSFDQKIAVESDAYLKLIPEPTAPAIRSSPGFFAGLKSGFSHIGYRLNDWFWNYGHFVTLGIGIACLGIAIYGKMKYRSRNVTNKRVRPSRKSHRSRKAETRKRNVP